MWQPSLPPLPPSPPCSPNDISSVEQNTARNISSHLILIIIDYLRGCEESWSLGEITHRIELRPAKKSHY